MEGSRTGNCALSALRTRSQRHLREAREERGRYGQPRPTGRDRSEAARGTEPHRAPGGGEPDEEYLVIQELCSLSEAVGELHEAVSDLQGSQGTSRGGRRDTGVPTRLCGGNGALGHARALCPLSSTR